MKIDFEKDQQDAMTKTKHIQSLADQVEKLESLQSRLELQEDNMKSTKKEIEKLSGDIIPTMMSEMGLAEFSQMIFSPGPLIYKLRQGLKNYTVDDYLLLTGDPAIIGVACSIVSDITNGKYNVLKWDKQERKYYPIAINLYEKGEIDGN